jgi:hypothetical protein
MKHQHYTRDIPMSEANMLVDYINRMHSDHQAALKNAVAKEREACLAIILDYQVPVGNSSAGEMACEWTMDALKFIRDEIRARGDK